MKALAVVLGAGLYLWAIPALADRVAVHVPVSWEERLGSLVCERLAPSEDRCGDPECQKALDDLVALLTAPTKDCPYTFRVVLVDNPQVNAFAAPGGYIVIHTGLVRRMEDAGELAGVLAHEIQHILLRHGTKAMCRQMSMRALVAVTSGDTEGMSQALEAAETRGIGGMNLHAVPPFPQGHGLQSQYGQVTRRSVDPRLRMHFTRRGSGTVTDSRIHATIRRLRGPVGLRIMPQ